MKWKKLTLLVRMSRPVFLLAGIGQVILGVGIAKYLGYTIDGIVYIQTLFWVILVQLAGIYLNEYFDIQVDRYNENRTIFSGGSGILADTGSDDKLSRMTALRAFIVATSLAGALTFTLLWFGEITSVAGLFMILIFGGLVLYSLPPIRFAGSGYGELVVAIIMGYLLPYFGFVMQAGELHRILALTGLPITFLALVFMLAVSFPDYAADLKYGKKTFLVRAGWENVMTVHNTLILLAFVSLASFVFFDYPRAIMLPAFIPLPLGLLQIWLMRQIESGAKPNWKSLTLNAAVMLGLMIYLFSYSFWTR